MSIAYLRKTRLSGSLPGRPCPPFTRLGRMVRYGIAELDAFMAAHKVNR